MDMFSPVLHTFDDSVGLSYRGHLRSPADIITHYNFIVYYVFSVPRFFQKSLEVSDSRV